MTAYVKAPHLKAHYGDSQLTVLKAICPDCNRGSEITVSTPGLWAWVQGDLIQEALPMLSNAQREFLITGYCQRCWDKMFEKEEAEL